ncbi:MAG: PAS domain S-box protein [Deltaproteobacteria bacterium]|nr:PAS domain S-box protein [Deltaproteobacteria bacterium]MBW2343049.1 PAS domain S-box protein [Deltaproteobacteria bacterium]
MNLGIRVIVICFLVLLFSAVGYGSDKDQVLILNSYHKGYPWTDDLVEGIARTLEKGRESLEIHVEYMDTKRINTSEYHKLFFQLMKLKYAKIKLDVIIISDDNAFHFIIKYHRRLFPDTPVVFMGVNHFEQSMIKGIENQITGLIQDADITATLRTALSLHPDTSQVAVICDATTTGQAYRKQVSMIEPDFKNLKFVYLDGRELSTPEMLSSLRSLPDDSIALLCIWLKDNTGVFVPWEDGYPKIAMNSKVPVYGVLDTMLKYGIVGGKVQSGKHHGIATAKIALRILRGEKVRHIPVSMKSPNKYIFDYIQLLRWKMPVSALPKGSIILNEPKSFYSKNKRLVWGVIGIFSFMVTTIIVLLSNIFGRRKAESNLRKSEEKYRSILGSIEEGYYEVDVDGNFTFFNKSLCKIYGCSKDDLMGVNLQEFTDEKTAKEGYRIFNRVFSTGTSIGNFGWEITRKNGSRRYVETSISPMRNAEGRLAGFRGIIRDTTDRLLSEKKLRESEERLQIILQSIPTPVVVYDAEGHAEYVNPAFTELFGWPLDELKGRHIPFVPKDQKELTGEKLNEVYDSGKNVQFETKRLTRQGDVIDVIVSGSYIKGLEGEAVQMIASLTDISERKRLEAQLQQALKMEAIGTLAGGIAHDFNNLLMGIQGRTSLMMVGKDSSYPDLEHIKGIEDCVKSAAELTRQLLGFARGGKYEIKPTDINKLIRKSSELFGRTKKEIDIHEKYQDNIWTVEVDQGQIEQTMMNLFVNSWQAMPGGGDLYLKTENITIEGDYVRPFEVKPGKYVKISIRDTGIGMDEKTKERIFEPFFTTKDMGKGTGLGLASVYGIIKNHGGFINVYSEKGKGTTFNIYLPTSEVAARHQEPEISKNVRHGDETVLLVDDEDMILDVGEQLLEKMGYTVLIARSGKGAIDIYEKKKDKIDLIILDMIMPEMSGGDTFDRLKQISPDTKVLLSSGYSINGQANEILGRGCDGFIQKPFSMEELSHKIRAVLNG